MGFRMFVRPSYYNNCFFFMRVVCVRQRNPFHLSFVEMLLGS